MEEKIKLTTSLGDIEIELFKNHAPLTVANFLNYVDEKFYDQTLFHRVINNFMIQGGGYERGMIEKSTKDPIINEADNGCSNLAYTIAMARTNDPHSATAQFFINVVDNKFLDFKSTRMEDFGYCVFGKVISGNETVDKIKQVSTETHGFNADVPIDDVVIESIIRMSGGNE